ncbi:leucyl aminopeptidase family protein [Paraliomyxa miuraensis]|uniref:leucyl aminopeptidase family protein n=1 Tax=Paraliomyxa miuraensis TaxID=376150 RepID=UPI00225C2662|nr:leucyl aminopeptidase family protein [Paraliomyxa miuraensis]MCX4243212.1 leucyl aminopeptidase family protein [Paraliomyxa miuraensis]
MTTLSFASSIKALLKGAHELLLIAPVASLSSKKTPRLFGRRVDALCRDLASDLDPGDRGAVSTSLGAEGLRWVHVGALPDRLSRYNCPARADSIRNVVAQAGLGHKGKLAIVLVLDDPAHALAAANAVSRALPAYTAKSNASRQRVQVLAVDGSGAVIPIDKATQHTVQLAREAAEIVDTPPSELHPAAFAARARALLEALPGVSLEELAGQDLVTHGLNGIFNVGKAASSAPRMLVATYEGMGHGKDAATEHVALVGKGVTFDTGGLHVKARGSMEGMKADMGGAAAVLGAFTSLVRGGCHHRLSLLLCLAENAIDAASYKPDDILHMHSGKTVEINNTDAEGRLLLADGVSWAARELEATVVIDAATLTGAQLVSTGLVHAAVVSNDEALERAAVEAGRHSGDLCHPLPFAPELYRHEFSSPVADMRNSVANRNNAQCSCAAQFVYEHLADAPKARSRRWCHIDLAGPAFPKDRGTGFGVALIAQLVRSL